MTVRTDQRNHPEQHGPSPAPKEGASRPPSRVPSFIDPDCADATQYVQDCVLLVHTVSKM
jgi:hypothetical protein